MQIRRLPSLESAAGWLTDQAAAQLDGWTLWTPVALGCGAALYFALDREPLGVAAWLTLAVAIVLFALAGRWRGPRTATLSLVLTASLLGGFAVAKFREQAVRAPVAPGASPPQRVEGWVVDVASPGEGGQRLLIAPVRVGQWRPGATPERLRITLREPVEIPPPGAPVSLLALVNPPPPPASPGAYDFARDAYFESVGGVGLALGPVHPASLSAPPWRLRVTMQVNAARWRLTKTIVEALGPARGGLAAAMTTGHEAFIPRDQVERLRIAGLAHIISISGLHMAIVGGFAFAAARLLVAAWPWLALRINGKKLAAVVGLAAVGGYLILSGAPPPAERAAITAAVAFAAILADRRAISLHALALAAVIVILLQPEAVTEPGFQMSFAATVSLVALAGAWPRAVREINTPWPIRAVQAGAAWIAVSLATSFVAGLATSPFALQHFNRISTWGLPANLAAAPVSSFLLMPALAVGAALSPFGMGHWPLQVAGAAIAAIDGVAKAAASAPHAQIIVASAPGWTLPVAFLGIIWLCLIRGALRWAAVPFAAAVMLAPRPPQPDVWVSADGSAVAARYGGQAVLLRPDVKRFGAELWARRRGLTPAEDAGVRDRLFNCDRLSCAPLANGPLSIAAAWNLKRRLPDQRLQRLCDDSEVLVWRNDHLPQACAARLALIGSDFARGGSVELYRTSGGWRAVWAQDLRGRRPWTWGVDDRLQ